MAGLARYCRKIFVGDVHGCFDELLLLLNRLKHDPKRDELYFVGDLVVKGPKSNDVVEFVRNTEKTYSVMGNHDYSLLTTARALNPNVKIPAFSFAKYLQRDPFAMKKHMDCAKAMSQANIEYLASMPLTLSPHPKLRVVCTHIIPITLSKYNWSVCRYMRE